MTRSNYATTLSSLAVTNAVGTTQEINYGEYAGGMVHVPNGETVVTLTWWASHDGVTYEAALHSVDEHVTPITYVATAQTVAADGSYPIPAELVGAKFLKIVGDVAATLHLSLKSS